MAQTSSQTSSAPSLSRADIDRAYEAVKQYLNVVQGVQAFLADFALHRRDLREDIRDALKRRGLCCFRYLSGEDLETILEGVRNLTSRPLLEAIRARIDDLMNSKKAPPDADHAWDGYVSGVIEQLEYWHAADEAAAKARGERPTLPDLTNRFSDAVKRDMLQRAVVDDLKPRLRESLSGLDWEVTSKILDTLDDGLPGSEAGFLAIFAEAIDRFVFGPAAASLPDASELPRRARRWTGLVHEMDEWFNGLFGDGTPDARQYHGCYSGDGPFSPVPTDREQIACMRCVMACLEWLVQMNESDARAWARGWEETISDWREDAETEYRDLLADANGQPRLAAEPPEPADKEPALSAAPSEPSPADTPKPKRGRGMPREEANRRAIPYLKEHPFATAPEVSKAIGCSQGLVPKLPAWQALQRARRAGRKPKAVGLTDRVLAATPAAPADHNAEMGRLIAEQEVDDKTDRVHPTV
ncbi:MAG: hypothetical protein ACYC35_28770 [Pirellulales bacterium]